MSSRLSRNTFILLSSNVGTALLAFLLTAIIGRGLGEAGLGRYAAVMAWIMPCTLLADAGINTLLTREIAADRRQTHFYLQQAYPLRWLIGGGIVLLIWLVAPLLSSDPAVISGLRIAALLVLIDTLFGTYTAVWRAWENMTPIFFLNIGYLLLQVIGTWIAVHQDYGLSGVLSATVIADALQLLATWIIWRRQNRNAIHSPGIYSWAMMLALLKTALPFAIAGLLAAIQLRITFVLLERLSTAEVVGTFAAASRFIEAAKMPPFALFGALFPRLAALSNTPESLKRLTSSIHLALSMYGLAAALFLLVFSQLLIKLVFGSDFAPAAPTLMILGWSLIPLLLRQHFTLLYYARQQEKFVNRVLLIALPFQMLLSAILIRQQGGEGAAWSLLITETALLLCLWQPTFLRWLLPITLILIGVWLYLGILHQQPFDGLYGQDAFAYYGYARDFYHGHVPEEMYWSIGFPVLLAVGFHLDQLEPVTAQTMVLLSGFALGLAGYWWLYETTIFLGYSRRQAQIGGLFAVGMLIFSGQVVQSSAVIMSDIPALGWAVASAGALITYARLRRKRWLLIAAGLLACAALTRWLYGILALPWALFTVMVWRYHLYWRKIALVLLIVGLITLPQILISLQNPDPVVGHDWLERWSPANFTRRDFVTADGTFHYQKPIALYYARAAWDGFYLHPMMLPLMGIGLVILLRKSRLVAIMVLGWLVLAYGFLAGIPYQNIRFSLAFLPPLVGLAAIGFVFLWDQLTRWKATGWIVQSILLLAVLIAWYSTFTQGRQAISQIIHNKNTDLGAVVWIDHQISEPAAIYTLDLWLMMQHYAPTLEARQIYYETPESLARTDLSHPTYLMLNLWAIEHQWQGKAPWTAYHWLENRFNLVYIGRYGNYTLLRVGDQ